MTKRIKSLSYSEIAFIILAIAAVLIFAFSIQRSGAFNLNREYSCGNPFEGQGRLRFNTSFWDLTDFCQHTVPLSEIRSGGPPPDGIPPIDNPQFQGLAIAEEWLQDQAPVISFELNGEARAYPLGVMTRHEIVNDEFGNTPVAVTYCPLCNSGIVFDRRVDDQTLRFGVSGNLRNSDMVMWDNVTESWWQQFTGEGIVGTHAGRQLQILPSAMVSFGAFKAQFPDGVVLSPTGRSGDGNTNPYFGYDSTSSPFLFDGEVDQRLFATERVLAGVIDGEAKAYSFKNLEQEKVINDTLGEQDVVAFWQPGATSALDRTEIALSRDVGMAALYRRDVNGQTLTFSINDQGFIIDDQTGSQWNVFGTAISGELEGTQLRQELAGPHFWFAWAAFRPETSIYGQ